MSNPVKVSNRLEKCISINFKEQQKLEDECLNKITMLQEQLSTEEQKLIKLLRTKYIIQNQI